MPGNGGNSRFFPESRGIRAGARQGGEPEAMDAGTGGRPKPEMLKIC